MHVLDTSTPHVQIPCGDGCLSVYLMSRLGVRVTGHVYVTIPRLPLPAGPGSESAALKGRGGVHRPAAYWPRSSTCNSTYDLRIAVMTRGSWQEEGL